MLGHLTVKSKAISSQAHQMMGRFNDYLEREYVQADGSALGPIRDRDIVSSLWKHKAASKGGLRLANSNEDVAKGILNFTAKRKRYSSIPTTCISTRCVEVRIVAEG